MNPPTRAALAQSANPADASAITDLTIVSAREASSPLAALSASVVRALVTQRLVSDAITLVIREDGRVTGSGYLRADGYISRPVGEHGGAIITELVARADERGLRTYITLGPHDALTPAVLALGFVETGEVRDIDFDLPPLVLLVREPPC